MAFAMGLALAPLAEAAANTTGVESLATATKKKTTTKKTTTKKTTTKKTTTTAKKATTTTTTKTTATPDATTGATSLTGTTTKAETTAKAATSTSSTGSSLLGGIISAIGGSSSSSSSKTGSLLSGLAAIFDATKGATKDRIVGTWTYTEPAVVFTSSNVLSSIGGKMAASTIENKLQTQLEKVGIKKGMMTMTFDESGNFTQTIGSRNTSGTYTISNNSVTLNYGGTVKQIVGTTQLDGNDLLIVMDASKLLKFANVLSSLSGSSTLSTLGSAISSISGMQVGLKLNK